MLCVCYLLLLGQFSGQNQCAGATYMHPGEVGLSMESRVQSRKGKEGSLGLGVTHMFHHGGQGVLQSWIHASRLRVLGFFVVGWVLAWVGLV